MLYRHQKEDLNENDGLIMTSVLPLSFDDEHVKWKWKHWCHDQTIMEESCNLANQ